MTALFASKAFGSSYIKQAGIQTPAVTGQITITGIGTVTEWCCNEVYAKANGLTTGDIPTLCLYRIGWL
jgi:hypothetical protein